MNLPVVAALLLGLLAAVTSGEVDAPDQCVEVQECFHDCIAYSGEQRFDLNVIVGTKDKAGGCSKIFCGKITWNGEITLSCTDANGVTRRVNYTRTGLDDPTSAAPSITGPRSMAPNSFDPKNTTGLSPGAMTGIIVAVIAGVVIAGVVIYYKKRKRCDRAKKSGVGAASPTELIHLNGSSAVTDHVKMQS
ncbi:uncharacterized protein LOC143767318 [Ranitomeya variabilis]|uniref:uncharacterized protein LOC143767318 n=1 Tax=Ranitomeya variabilis TaxID=490064 RepID=UPI0040575C23